MCSFICHNHHRHFVTLSKTRLLLLGRVRFFFIFGVDIAANKIVMVLSKLIRMVPVRNAEHLKCTLFRRGIFQRTQLFTYSAVSMPASSLSINTSYQQKPEPCHMQKRFFADKDSDNRQNFNLNLDKRRQRLTENIAQKRIQVNQHKQHLIQGIRDKKTKVQNKVRQIEEIVERENIFTIPNVLCVGRSILAPYIGYVIVQGDYQMAIGLLALAGITDFVCFSQFNKKILCKISHFINLYLTK